MRIGMFADSYHPYRSGVVRSIDTFRTALAAAGHETFVFAPAYPGMAGPEPGVFRFRSVPAPNQREFHLAIPLSPRVRSTIRSLRLDLIHVHSPFLLGGLGARAARRTGLPLVFTYHTLYDEYAHYVPVLSSLSRSWLRRYARDFCNRCDWVIAPGASIAQRLRQQGVRVPIAVVPTGVDPDRLKGGDGPGFRRRFGLEGRTILLYTGRISREKNLGFLLEVIDRVRRRRPDALLLLVGAGPSLPALRTEVTAHELDRHVRFTGWLGDTELADAYAAADCYVFASQSETQGIVLVEAMAAGLPVVALTGPGVSDVIRHGRDGLCLPPDPDRFAAEVVALCADDAARRRLARAARQRAETFRPARVTERLLTVYRAAVATRMQGGPMRNRVS